MVRATAYRSVLIMVWVLLLSTVLSSAQSGKRKPQEPRGIKEVPAIPSTTPGAQRTALVMGNAAYSPDIGPLQNPVSDAVDMAATLQKLGFTVTLVRDADKQRMMEAVEAFGRQLRPQDVGLFYFAGHGAAGTDGQNYLIPIGARITKALDIQYQGVSADWVLAHMEESRESTVNILILDACRNAPFRSLWRTAPRGLAPMYGTGGSLIAYATAPGKTASEGRGQRNGIYTKHLLRFMSEPNLPIAQMFRQVRVAVEQETRAQDGSKQTPWESSSLREEFYFNPQADTSSSHLGTSPSQPSFPPPTTPASGGSTSAPDKPLPGTTGSHEEAIEIAFWNSVKDTKKPAALKAYLQKYPQGQFASLATLKIKELTKSPKPAPQVPPVVSSSGASSTTISRARNRPDRLPLTATQKKKQSEIEQNEKKQIDDFRKDLDRLDQEAGQWGLR